MARDLTLDDYLRNPQALTNPQAAAEAAPLGPPVMRDGVKQSELLKAARDKYPQYKDTPDDQLLLGIHRTLYSHIPRSEFFGKIDYDVDRERNDPAKQPW